MPAKGILKTKNSETISIVDLPCLQGIEIVGASLSSLLATGIYVYLHLIACPININSEPRGLKWLFQGTVLPDISVLVLQQMENTRESHSMSDAAFFIDIVLTCISKKLNVSDHKVSKWVNLVYLCLLSSVHANT